MLKLNIRFAQPDDMTEVISMCELHAQYEKAIYSPTGKAETLASHIFCDQPRLFCLVAEMDDTLVGYATCMHQFSTWDADLYIYMDCLFIKEAWRGKNIGEKMIRRIQLEAQKADIETIQWQTPDFNTRAIKFYHRIGAVAKPKERFFLTV